MREASLHRRSALIAGVKGTMHPLVPCAQSDVKPTPLGLIERGESGAHPHLYLGAT